MQRTCTYLCIYSLFSKKCNFLYIGDFGGLCSFLQPTDRTSCWRLVMNVHLVKKETLLIYEIYYPKCEPKRADGLDANRTVEFGSLVSAKCVTQVMFAFHG